MIMSRKNHSDVMGLEQRHVSRPHRSGLWFELWPAMRAGRKHWVMKGCNNIGVTISIQALELFPRPFKLRGVSCNIGVESHNEGIAVAEGIGRIPRQAPRRVVGRDQLRHRF